MFLEKISDKLIQEEVMRVGSIQHILLRFTEKKDNRLNSIHQQVRRHQWNY